MSEVESALIAHLRRRDVSFHSLVTFAQAVCANALRFGSPGALADYLDHIAETVDAD
jgi:hypothetical protein